MNGVNWREIAKNTTQNNLLKKNTIYHEPKPRYRPHEDLYIYYLKGRLKLENRMFLENFIGQWEEEDDSILFFSSAADRQIEKLLLRQPQLQYLDSYQMSYDHWLGEAFSTFEYGKFRIIPPWEISAHTHSEGNFTDKLLILLDPGLVFGTGTHPTTRNCLEALELAVRSKHFTTVLDLGTGTGLLALASVRLGCKHAVGVDLNLLAAKTAQNNVRLNHLEDQVVIVQGRAEDMIAYPSELLIANIHYDVMQHLIAAKGFGAKRHFILSGLMRSEAKDIADKLAGISVEIVKQWTDDGIWHTIYGKTVKRDL